MQKRKFIIVLGDGMSDHEDKDGSTPLSLAKKPFIDSLAGVAELGLCRTVPLDMSPGSDTANLSVLGYDPKIYYTGRSPLEAASIGVKLNEGDIAYRLNFVTLSTEDTFEDRTMLSYSAHEIDTKGARGLIELLKPYCPFELYAGVSYRHCMVWKNKGEKTNAVLVPPHDISDRPIKGHLPISPFLEFMKKASEVLSNSDKNSTKANAVWIWGEGKKPMLTPFKEKFGLSGAVISEVDLIKGIGLCAEMENINVEGADATLETNYEGMVEAALSALKRHDFVFLHIEAPDEQGHIGSKEGKIKAIEYLDSRVVKPLVQGLEKNKLDYKILLCPDHATPYKLKTHTHDAVPYLIYDPKNKIKTNLAYTERACKSTGNLIDPGHKLIKRFINFVDGF